VQYATDQNLAPVLSIELWAVRSATVARSALAYRSWRTGQCAGMYVGRVILMRGGADCANTDSSGGNGCQWIGRPSCGGDRG